MACPGEGQVLGSWTGLGAMGPRGHGALEPLGHGQKGRHWAWASGRP